MMNDLIVGEEINTLQNNKVYHKTVTIEIIDMQEPQMKNLKEGDSIPLFKYHVRDGWGNDGFIISWRKHINYKVGDILQLSSFYVKEFMGEKQLIVSDKTIYNKIESNGKFLKEKSNRVI